MHRLHTVLIQILLGVAGITHAQSPPGIFPQASDSLALEYAGSQVNPGAVVPLSAVQASPTIGVAMMPQATASGTKYLFVMVDLDASSQQSKRDDGTPSVSTSPDATQQPEDSDHQSGKSTYLQCMTQDLEFSSTQFGPGAFQLTGGNNAPAAYEAPNPSSSNSPAAHRYMSLLFEQPSNFSIPAAIETMISSRQSFDLREFIQQCNLPLPMWSNFFVCSRPNQSLSSWFTSFTPGQPFPTESFRTHTKTITKAIPTTVTSVITLGGLTTTTTFIGRTTVVSTTTFGGGLTTSTSLLTSSTTTGIVSATPISTSTSLFSTTTTLPNGGPTVSFLTSSATTLFQTTSLRTLTTSGTFTSTFTTSSNGILTTVTSTRTGVATTTGPLAVTTNGAERLGQDGVAEKAAVGLAGLLLWLL